MSQEELAEKLNVSRQAVSRWEMGTAQPDAQNILQLSHLFTVSTDFLLNDDYDEPQAEILPKTHKKRLSAFQIILLILGSPIWISLLIAAFAIILAVYISLLSIIVSLWAVFASFIACALGGIIGGIALIISTNRLSGTALLALGITFIGFSIFTFYGCKAASKGIILLTKKTVDYLKQLIKKEVA